MKVFQGRLVISEARYKVEDVAYVVRVDHAEVLPTGFEGTWNYESLTGTAFSGPADAATRDEANRVGVSRFQSVVPFTDAEMQAISDYRLAKTGPIPAKSNTRIYWLAGTSVAIALGSVGVILYRRRMPT